MLLGVANRGHIQNIRNMVILESVHLETNGMQKLYKVVTGPIPWHCLIKIFE